jgi:hypothetical protein
MARAALTVLAVASVLGGATIATASSLGDIYNYGDIHESVGQSPPHPTRQGDHPRFRQGVTYKANAVPLLITLRDRDGYWGGAQFESGRFRFVQLFHSHRSGDPPLKGVGLITFEAATGATPSVAATVQHLHGTPQIDAGPITPASVAGFAGKQFDATILGTAAGISLFPFTKDLHCGYCTQTMHGETLDAKFAGKGTLFRIIVVGVRGKTVVIYLESLFAIQPKYPPAKLFPMFLPYAQKMLATVRFPG